MRSVPVFTVNYIMAQAESEAVSIFLITGDRDLAARLSHDLAFGQTLRGHDVVDDLIAWLKEARKLVTGNPHWAVYDLDLEEIERITNAFPRGAVLHLHCAQSENAVTYAITGGKRGQLP